MSERPAADSATFDPSRILERGMRSDDLERLRAVLTLPADAEEPRVVRELLAFLLERQLAQVSVLHAAQSEPGLREDASRVLGTRASFLVRLTTGGHVANVDIERLDDLRTLLAVLRAGSLRQRRAAALRLGDLLDEPRGHPAALVSKAVHVVASLRTFAIAYELGQVCARLPGPEGRAARTRQRAWEALVTRLEHDVRAFWDGDANAEPVCALDDADRVHLLARVRDMPDDLVRHIGAVITGADGASREQDRMVLLGALQSAGDPRLLPALRSLLEGPETTALVPAARALARIDDLRVHPILKSAFLRTSIAEHKLVLAGALGVAGDSRGLPYVREVLSTRDEKLLPRAIEAIGYLGGTEDVHAVATLLEHPDPALVHAAVEALGRFGDGRALIPFAQLAGKPINSALRGELEDAEAALRARLELLGEEPPALEAAAAGFDTAKMAALSKRPDPSAIRFRARWHHAMALFWLGLGSTRRALARLDSASALQPEWSKPLILAGTIYARRDEHARALASFRRALETDRVAVEHNGAAIELLAQSFLRRAEAVSSDGRSDIAQGLLEEALALDLRRAPTGLRFALVQRLDALKGSGA